MTKMKKALALGLAGILAVSFAACSKGGDGAETTTDAATSAAAKTGYAVTASVGHISHDETENKCEIDTVVAAVLVDADGKVITCQIDEAQTQPNLEVNDGFVDEAALRTKKEKKEDYGMKGVSPIGLEWYEQIDAFEQWAVGKTADEIAAGIDEAGTATDADLAAGCTIYAGGFKQVVVDAINNATECGASSTDTLKLVLDTEKYYESKAGELVQYDTNIAVVTTDDAGKITSCIIDATQGKCYVNGDKFVGAPDATDYITVDVQSKKQLGDAYGMKGVSAGIGVIPEGGEWFEQAAAFETWAIGKTADEITAAVGEDGKSADADLTAGCTITISAIAKTVAEAATK